MKLLSIKIADAKESATNVPGRTEGKSFDELVASIKEKGVLVPVLVRQFEVNNKYEVIAGNRRLAAARIAGLNEIPAHLVEMNDNEAREAQIVENLQREDVHPLEEGEQYRELIENAKYDTTSLAVKVGKSESYVKQRLFLTNLEPKSADAFRSGKILDGHAVLIAKLSALDQAKALKATTDRYNTMTVKELKEWIDMEINSPLECQPWLKSKELMEVVGKCVECKPNRQSLFGDIKEGACTDLKCWARKMSNYITSRCKEGHLTKVSTDYGQAAKGVLSRDSYVQVGKKDQCKSVHGAIVAEGSNLTKEFEICTDKNCKKHYGMRSQYGLTPKEQEARKLERKKEIEKAKKAKADRINRLEKALEKVAWPLNEQQLEALYELSFNSCSSNAFRSIAKRRELEVKKVKNSWGNGFTSDYKNAVKEAGKNMAKAEKLRLTFELLIDTGYDSLREGIGKI